MEDLGEVIQRLSSVSPGKTPVSAELADVIRTVKGKRFKTIEGMATSLKKQSTTGARYEDVKAKLLDLNDRLNVGEVTVEEYLDEGEFKDVRSAVLEEDIPMYDASPAPDPEDQAALEQHQANIEALNAQIGQMEEMVDMGPNSTTMAAPLQSPNMFVENQEELNNDWGEGEIGWTGGPDEQPVPAYATSPQQQFGFPSPGSSFDEIYDDVEETPVAQGTQLGAPLAPISEYGSNIGNLANLSPINLAALSHPSSAQSVPPMDSPMQQAQPALSVSEMLANSEALNRTARNAANNVYAGFTDDKLKRANILGLDLTTAEGVAAYQRDRQQRANDAGSHAPARTTDDQWRVKQRYFNVNSFAPVTRYT